MVRAFVALDLPDDVRTGIARWSRTELADEALRPVEREQLHLTLCFLGSVPDSAVKELAAIVRGLTARPVPMTFEREPVARPKGRPRLFALAAHSPAAVELQAELQAKLVAAGQYEPENRPFWPHVTVARVRAERGRPRKYRRVNRRPGELPGSLVHTFGSVRVALYRSKLRPEGAQYVSLANLELPPEA